MAVRLLRSNRDQFFVSSRGLEGESGGSRRGPDLWHMLPMTSAGANPLPALDEASIIALSARAHSTHARLRATVEEHKRLREELVELG